MEQLQLYISACPAGWQIVPVMYNNSKAKKKVREGGGSNIILLDLLYAAVQLGQVRYLGTLVAISMPDTQNFPHPGPGKFSPKDPSHSSPNKMSAGVALDAMQGASRQWRRNPRESAKSCCQPAEIIHATWQQGWRTVIILAIWRVRYLSEISEGQVINAGQHTKPDKILPKTGCA